MRQGRYEEWVAVVDQVFEEQDPRGRRPAPGRATGREEGALRPGDAGCVDTHLTRLSEGATRAFILAHGALNSPRRSGTLPFQRLLPVMRRNEAARPSGSQCRPV